MCALVYVSYVGAVEQYDLPALPAKFAPLDHDRFATNYSNPLGKSSAAVKHIPRLMWISFKTRPESIDDISDELVSVINRARQEGWTVYCLGHVEQMQFLEIYYPETSLLWAAKMIHPNAGAAVSDIWRVAAVYAFGGMYMDDDSIIETSLEEVVQPSDRFILGREKHKYGDSCYHRKFHLAGEAISEKYNVTGVGDLFGGRGILQWLFLAEAEHKILRQIILNLAEVLRLEYLGGFSMYRLATEPTWKFIICGTGPGLWTSTIREMVVSKELAEDEWRLLNKHDFVEYGAVYKLEQMKHLLSREGSHYMYKMIKDRSLLLSSYAPFNITHYEHRAVSDGGRTFYYIDKGVRRNFPNYDTYTMMGFSKEDTFVIPHDELVAIPMGDDLPAISDL